MRIAETMAAAVMMSAMSIDYAHALECVVETNVADTDRGGDCISVENTCGHAIVAYVGRKFIKHPDVRPTVAGVTLLPGRYAVYCRPAMDVPNYTPYFYLKQWCRREKMADQTCGPGNDGTFFGTNS